MADMSDTEGSGPWATIELRATCEASLDGATRWRSTSEERGASVAVVAFPGGRGTWDMVHRAKTVGVDVRAYAGDGEAHRWREHARTGQWHTFP